MLLGEISKGKVHADRRRGVFVCFSEPATDAARQSQCYRWLQQHIVELRPPLHHSTAGLAVHPLAVRVLFDNLRIRMELMLYVCIFALLHFTEPW